MIYTSCISIGVILTPEEPFPLPWISSFFLIFRISGSGHSGLTSEINIFAVHYQVHIGNIQASTGHVCSCKNLSVPALKHGKTSHSLLLRPHAVQGGGGDANLGQEDTNMLQKTIERCLVFSAFLPN